MVSVFPKLSKGLFPASKNHPEVNRFCGDRLMYSTFANVRSYRTVWGSRRNDWDQDLPDPPLPGVMDLCWTSASSDAPFEVIAKSRRYEIGSTEFLWTLAGFPCSGSQWVHVKCQEPVTHMPIF